VTGVKHLAFSTSQLTTTKTNTKAKTHK